MSCRLAPQTHGTQVNNKPIPAHKPVALKDGTSLKFGNYTAKQYILRCESAGAGSKSQVSVYPAMRMLTCMHAVRTALRVDTYPACCIVCTPSCSCMHAVTQVPETAFQLHM